MKAKLFSIISLLFAVMPATVLARSDSDSGDIPSIQIEAQRFEASDAALREVVSAPSTAPRGPQDVLNDYEAEIVGVTQRFSARVTAIAEAVQDGQLSREQGQKLSTEQYQMAQMQFELLSAWRDMLEQDLARTPSVNANNATAQSSEIVMVALPFSSLQLSPSLAQYLGLTESQSKAIQQLMTEERRNLEPLMAEMRTNKEKLLAATATGPANEKEVKTLASAQAGMMAKLIVANSRMEERIYKILSREQQKKLDDFKRTSEPMIATR